MEFSDIDHPKVNEGYRINTQLYDQLSFAAGLTKTVLWNKFQIIIYEDFNFKDTPLEYVPDFIIAKVVPSKQYLICLDCNGNVHTISTRNKKSNNKRLKTGFLPRDKGISNIVYYNQDFYLTIKLDTEICYLALHKVGLEFQMIGRYSVKCDIEKWDLQEQLAKSFLKCLQINETDKLLMKNMFTVTDFNTDNYLVILTFDGKTVYGCIFNPKYNDDIELKKIYTCPLEICDLILENSCLDIILKSGTVIHVNLEENTHNIVHLNSAVSTVCQTEKNIIYTNGSLMWKAENYHSDKNITFTQLSHRNCKDFVQIGNKIISITYSNLIYMFDMTSDIVYINKQTKEDYYYTAESLLSNTESFNKIFDEIDKTQVVTKQIQIESNYLAAMALVKRQGIMDNIIKYHMYVYENYETGKYLEHTTLTNKIEEYFKLDCLLINLKMELKGQNEIKSLFNCLAKDFKLHISIFSRQKLIKIVSISITNIDQITNYLTPVDMINNSADLLVKVNLVAALPGPLDVKQKIWTNISRKEITLNAEQFLATTIASKNINYLKENIHDNCMMLKILEALHGTNLNFVENFVEENKKDDFKFYMKLPNDYTEHFNLESCSSFLTKQQIEYLSTKITAKDFLNGKCSTTIHILKEKVNLSIENDDFSNNLLVITSGNVEIALQFRRFFSCLLYKNGTVEGTYFVPQSHYAYIENLQRSLKNELEGESDEGTMMKIAEMYHRNVIGAMPL